MNIRQRARDFFDKSMFCLNSRIKDDSKNKKNPSKLKTENGGISHIGMTKLPTEAPFFLFGGRVQPILYKKKEPMNCKLPRKFIGSASVRLAL